MIERMFRHTALASHWLILFSILVYFKHRDHAGCGCRLTWCLFLLLESAAMGIHPYFLPMVACFSLLCVIEDCRQRRFLSIPAFFVQQGLVLLVGYVLGAVGGRSFQGRGFGLFSMNLNALINPYSIGGYSWSSLLPIREQRWGNYDGFNYLGLGILLALPVLLALRLWMLAKEGTLRDKIRTWLRRNCWLLLACLGLTVFALSNVVTLEGNILFQYPLPGFVLNLCSIFRASARMFYPVFYLIYLAVLVLLWQCRPLFRGRHWVYAACVLVCAVQLWDMRGMIAEKRAGIREGIEATRETFLFGGENLPDAAGAEGIILLNRLFDPRIENELALWGLKHGMDIYYSLSVGGLEDVSGCEARREEILRLIQDTRDLHHFLLITDEEDLYQQYAPCANTVAWKYLNLIYMIYEIEE